MRTMVIKNITITSCCSVMVMMKMLVVVVMVVMMILGLQWTLLSLLETAGKTGSNAGTSGLQVLLQNFQRILFLEVI